MSEQILETVKKSIGGDSDNAYFNPDLIMHINSVFSILRQMGAGPTSGFRISTGTEEWHNFSTDESLLDLVKTYICLKVKLLFDPPISSIVTEVINREVAEYEWRISVHVDPTAEEIAALENEEESKS